MTPLAILISGSQGGGKTCAAQVVIDAMDKAGLPCVVYSTAAKLADGNAREWTLESRPRLALKLGPGKRYTLDLIDLNAPEIGPVGVSFKALEPWAAKLGQSAYADHNPNPLCVQLWCAAEKIQLDDDAYECLVGAWVLGGMPFNDQDALFQDLLEQLEAK